MGNKSEEEFYTQHGRKVYGGGGINPDISVGQNMPPRYIQDLERRRLFFDFVVDYVAQDSTRGLEELLADGDMTESFKTFVRQRNERDGYDIGQGQLKALKNIVEEFGWVEIKSSLEGLDKAFNEEQKKGFTPKLESYIHTALRRELVLRFQGRKAEMLVALEEDSQLAEAIRVLLDREIYERALVKKD